MLIANGDGTYTGGPLDVICVLVDVTTGRFHAAYFEERPMPGPIPGVTDDRPVRLMSKMHHTEGADTWAGALDHAHAMTETITLPTENVMLDEAWPWDGEQATVRILPNWRAHAQDTAQ